MGLMLAANFEAVVVVIVAIEVSEWLEELAPHVAWLPICLVAGLFVIIWSWVYIVMQLKPRTEKKEKVEMP